MRARTRMREKERLDKRKQLLPPTNEHFFEEDYQKIRKLLGKPEIG